MSTTSEPQRFLPPISQEAPPSAIAMAFGRSKSKAAAAAQPRRIVEDADEGLTAGQSITEGATTLGALAKQCGVRLVAPRNPVSLMALTAAVLRPRNP